MKLVYVLMAALAGLLYTIGDSFFKMKIQNHMEVGILDIFKFWTLPLGVVIGLIVAYGLGFFGKFLSIYPLKEVDISTYAPLVVVFAILLSALAGAFFFHEKFTYVKILGIILAVSAIYLLTLNT
jgi:multidrug transporter EmrE-like cation transporter|tara:strand:+ start:615 stop:989 length:375 start_codon:yes stop_codon:yes gene_type:complete